MSVPAVKRKRRTFAQMEADIEAAHARAAVTEPGATVLAITSTRIGGAASAAKLKRNITGVCRGAIVGPSPRDDRYVLLRVIQGSVAHGAAPGRELELPIADLYPDTAEGSTRLRERAAQIWPARR